MRQLLVAGASLILVAGCTTASSGDSASTLAISSSTTTTNPLEATTTKFDPTTTTQQVTTTQLTGTTIVLFEVTLDEAGNNGPFKMSESAVAAGVCERGWVYYSDHEFLDGWTWSEWEFVCGDDSGTWVMRREARAADGTPTLEVGVWKLIDKPNPYGGDKGKYEHLEGSGSYTEDWILGYPESVYHGELTLP